MAKWMPLAPPLAGSLYVIDFAASRVRFKDSGDEILEHHALRPSMRAGAINSNVFPRSVAKEEGLSAASVQFRRVHHQQTEYRVRNREVRARIGQ